MYLTRTFAFSIHRKKLKSLGRWPDFKTKHSAKKLQLMHTHQAVSHTNDENDSNTITSLNLTNDNIFPGSTRLAAAEHPPQPEQHQQGHGCSLTSTNVTMPVPAMAMLQIYSDRSPVMPELVFTNSDTQSANGDVSWGGGLCGGEHGGVACCSCVWSWY